MEVQSSYVKKVYLDLQIWDRIYKEESIKEFFEKKNTEWKYFISVAHLEELYRARKGEKGEKIGLTDELEKVIREMAEQGILEPTNQGIKYFARGYEKAYEKVITYDTRQVVLDISHHRNAIEKQVYESKDLFIGVSHNQENAYQVVWDTIRISEEINRHNKNAFKYLQTEFSANDNSLRELLVRQYGKDNAEKMLQELLRGAETEIRPAIYNQIVDDYSKLEYVMEELYHILTRCGFKREKNDKHANSSEYDIYHSICATLCDIFITADEKFAEKYKAVAYYLGIPIKIMLLDEAMKVID